jgi:hypothetical protein
MRQESTICNLHNERKIVKSRKKGEKMGKTKKDYLTPPG